MHFSLVSGGQMTSSKQLMIFAPYSSMIEGALFNYMGLIQLANGTIFCVFNYSSNDILM